MYFVDVILPIPLNQAFTYAVDADDAAVLQTGMRVAVPFGKSKIYTGIVFKVHENKPVGYDVKEIDQILDSVPTLTINQLKHWQWMAKYYMCSLGEVLRAALPSAFLLESETLVTATQNPNLDETTLTDEEFLVFEALQHQQTLHINDVKSILDKNNVVKTIQSLLSKNVIEVHEEVFEIYKPKIKRYIQLSKIYETEQHLQELLEQLSKAPRQRDVVLTLFMLQAQQKKPIEAQLLQKKSKVSASIINVLIDKNILEEYHLQKDRIIYDGDAPKAIKALNEAQETCFEQIKENFEKNDVTLLHGVTSSGKTEIYVRLISEMIQTGKQVLYMLPEIALTTQLISRLQLYFAERVSVYHSKYTLNERVEVWNNVLHSKPKAQIILGARSSIFLPFQNLGLIIVDEEHEQSYKQQAPAPRYHARDAAIVLGNLHHSKIIMGSATPSLESFYNAKIGKYGLAILKKRYGDVQLPEIELIDLKEKYFKKQMTGHFSHNLIEEMKLCLEFGEQIILFQNRRGFSPVVECTTCGVSPQCPNCDVSLTYHQHKSQLRCHYCGYHIVMIQKCMACGNATLDTLGLGTERIENELKSLFPNHNIGRMDQDTTRGKHSYSKLIDALDNQEIDILVGTQMLAKGLDFRNIGLVGVMNADTLLYYPDFRAHERSFQLLQQVAGRAGRTKKQGKVLIQSFNPNHKILKLVRENDFIGMYNAELEDRSHYKYPPYFRILKITFKDKNLSKLEVAAIWFGQALQLKLKEFVLGPEAPPVARIRNKYITNILVKIPKDQSLEKTKQYISSVQKKFGAIQEFTTLQVTIDVDNY